MRIDDNNYSSERYAVISYSHRDNDAFAAEAMLFDDHSICYWFDEDMQGGESYEKQFRDKLDHDNCGGCMFFISEEFLLSRNCANEVKYFIDKYGDQKSDAPNNKFCFFVLPERFAVVGSGTTDNKLEKFSALVEEYAKTHPTAEVSGEELSQLIKNHVELFLKASKDCKRLYGVLGNKNGYIDKYTTDGQTFYKAGIIYGHKKVIERPFGFFPQNETAGDTEEERFNPFEMDEEKVLRELDKKPAYYAPVDWLVISDNRLVSKELLFAVDYMNLKYPIAPTKETVATYISNVFSKHFRCCRPKETPEYKIKNVRFLKEGELAALLLRADHYSDSEEKLQRRRDVLLPKPTYFAQVTNRNNAYAFWLASPSSPEKPEEGEENDAKNKDYKAKKKANDELSDARRVDSYTGRLSDQPVGVELYYVRVVIEVEKVGG